MESAQSRVPQVAERVAAPAALVAPEAKARLVEVWSVLDCGVRNAASG